MKKIFFFAATAALVVSCSSDEAYIPETANQGSVIEFGTNTANATRANVTGDVAAGLLGNKFVVYGQKIVESVPSSSFDGVAVTYDNSDPDPLKHAWDYVTASEAARYWDKNATSYDFYAYSDANTSSVVTVPSPSSNIYAAGINLKKSTAEDLSKVYVAPAVSVAKAQFNQNVKFEFKNTVSKVRVAFYSNIAGYNVKVNNFYVTADTKTTSTVFKGTFFSKASYSVAADGTQAKTDADDDVVDLVLGDNITTVAALGTDKANAIFDKDDKTYTLVLPTMGDAKAVKIKIDYTLTSTSTGETIPDTKEVTVTSDNFEWQPNYAYTYYFKLSNTMEPIKFEAEVVPFTETDVDVNFDL